MREEEVGVEVREVEEEGVAEIVSIEDAVVADPMVIDRKTVSHGLETKDLLRLLENGVEINKFDFGRLVKSVF